MSLPELPLLLYAAPSWYATPSRVYLYVQEKKLPSSFLKIVSDLDEAELEAYPKPPDSTVPKLAIPRNNAPTAKASPASYRWLTQSIAIMEYLEDLCDNHPQISLVPSLRGGTDLEKRAIIRGVLFHVEGIFDTAGITLQFGSTPYNALTHTDAVHVPSAQAVVSLLRRMYLEPLNSMLLPEACDYEAIRTDQIGGATIADIALFATLRFWRDIHGKDLAAGYANIERLIAAFDCRRSSRTTIPREGYPEWAKAFRTGFVEGIWREENKVQGD